MSQPSNLPWYRQLTPYHWFVFLVASAAWCFDCMDQRLFTLARVDAVTSLMTEAALEEKGGPLSETEAAELKGRIQDVAKYVNAVFLVGWGFGGLILGALGDRHGRARMLIISVLIYSGCTGLNFFSHTVWDFSLFRFLTGFGVGGVFGLAVSLIAETLTTGARAGALGWLQVISAGGNLTAAAIYSFVTRLETNDVIADGTKWRWVFLVGALPAFLVILIWRYLKEPEPWLRAKEAGTLPKGSILAPYVGLVTNLQWRKNLIIGTLIASAGVVGCWAIAEFAFDLQKIIFTDYYTSQGLSGDALIEKVSDARSMSFVLFMLGAAAGMWLFTVVAERLGRIPAFYIWFSAALGMTVITYYFMNSPMDAYWMLTLMGVAQMGLFAGYAIYLPELFPSSMRSTGSSFCYNIGRFAAAGGSLASAAIAAQLYGHLSSPLKERYAAITMCAIFLVGLAALPFAPETKGKPLPE
jgi:MFS family permease